MKRTLGRIVRTVLGLAFKFLLYACVIMGLIWLGKTSYQFGYDVFNEHAVSPGEGREVTVVIGQEQSVYEVGVTLMNKGLIERPEVFWVQELLSLHHGEIKPGTYVLSTAYTPSRILEILSEGQETPEAAGEGSES